MTSPEPNARPSQVTVAAWAVTAASVMLLVAAIDTTGSLHSLEMRERLTRTVTSGSGKDLGLTVDGLIEMLRWSMFVTGVGAVAAGILGPYVLKKNRSARIGLTVAAVPIVLVAPLAGSILGVFLFLGVFIGAATATLWSRPAQDWFAGRPTAVRPAPSPPVPAQRSTPTPTPWSPPAPGSAQPPPTPGWGQAPGSVPPAPPEAASWPAPAPAEGSVPFAYPTTHPAPPATAGASRPQPVLVACVLTWIFSAVTGIAYLALLVAVAVDSDAVMKEVRKAPGWNASYDDHTVLVGLTTVSVLLVLWCAAAAVLAVFAWRRARWAWMLLVGSASLAALLSLVAFPYSLLHVAAIGASAGMLLGQRSRDWYAGTAPRAPGPPPAPRPPVW